MSAKFKKSLYCFRRDLRLEDNTALIAACKASDEVIPVFIFDPRQTETNDYFSANAFEFMIQSLREVDESLQKLGSRLYIFSGKSDESIESLIKAEDVEAVFVNHDYTPFAQQRDQAIEDICTKHDVDFKTYADYLLQEPDTALKKDGSPYLVFTPFYKNSRQLPVPDPIKFSHKNLHTDSLQGTITLDEIKYEHNSKLRLKGGRSEAIQILKSLDPQYNEGRDFPAQSSTTLLSAHHKFGTISVRESYNQLKKFYGPDHTVLSELYWRDFFTHIAHHFPRVFGDAFQEKFNDLSWSEDEEIFAAWCQGRTGFPIVDAGMRELNTTGYMHNRVRMITASFLVKNLQIDWRKGERYFAQKLIDYDPCVNNGNWQWAASTGVDAQPFFRVFNPWRQAERFDKECEYIKHWCPELKTVPHKNILKWDTKHTEYNIAYPAPIVDHKISSQQTKDKYRTAHEGQKKLSI